MPRIDPRNCVLAVRNPNNSKILGTAFLISQKDLGYATTCYHVVKDHAQLELYFVPEKKSIPVQISQEYSNEDFDIAVLKFLESPPTNLQLLDFAQNDEQLPGKSFNSFGFQNGFDGFPIVGRVAGNGKPKQNAPETVDGEGLLALDAKYVEEGASGAPVVIDSANKIAGMIIGFYKKEEDPSGQFDGLVFAQTVRSLFHVCRSLIEEPLKNRSEWLRHMKLKIDPFKFMDGGNDKYLEHYFYKVPHLDEIYGDVSNPDTVFVFGRSGTGRSSLRKVVAEFCLKERALPIVLSDFGTLASKGNSDTRVNFGDYASFMIKACIRVLATKVNAKSIQINESLPREHITILCRTLWTYIDRYEIDQINLHELKKFLSISTSEDTLVMLPEDSGELLSQFCDYVQELFDYRSLYFLIDPIFNFSPNEDFSWRILHPLVSVELRVFSEHGIAFRFFLDENLSEYVSKVPWIIPLQRDLLYHPLNWTGVELSALLIERLKGSSEMQPRYSSLNQLSELDHLHDMVVGYSDSPRELIAICNRLFSAHCRQPIDRRRPLITRDTVCLVLRELNLGTLEPVAVQILSGKYQLNPFTVVQLIKEGENAWVELKSTLRWNIKGGHADPKLEKAIAKTLCGFMNSEGGLLVIGVDDHGNAIGLEDDQRTLGSGKQNENGFELRITDIIDVYLELRERQNVDKIGFFDYDDKRICILSVSPSSEPIYFFDTRHQYCIRVGNSTRELDTKQALVHIRDRFA